MKIEYTELVRGVWPALHNNEVIGGIAALNAETSESGFNVIASDQTTPEPTVIPGSPFSSVNHAKAAMEYHFRNLTDKE